MKVSEKEMKRWLAEEFLKTAKAFTVALAAHAAALDRLAEAMKK